MNPDFLLFLLIFLGVDAIALISLLIYRIRREMKREKILHFGDRAEEKVSEYLEKEFPGAAVLNNVYLKSGRNSVTQLDHILLCKWGIFVIETKSHNGRIETRGKEWIQFYRDKVVRFHSPLLQNKIHCKALEYVIRGYDKKGRIPVKGIVVFTSDKVYLTQRTEGVLKLSQIGPYIKSGGKQIRHRKAITAQVGGKYLSLNKIKTLEKWIRKNSVKSFRRKQDHKKMVRTLDHNRI